jgi:hypothetical protein
MHRDISNTIKHQQHQCIKNNCRCLQYPLYLRCYFDHSPNIIAKLTAIELDQYNSIIGDACVEFQANLREYL